MTEDKNLVPQDMKIDDPGKAIDMVQSSMENFIAVADVKRVYGQPVQHGETIIIPAAEVVAGMGFGAGYGAGGPDDANGVGGGGGGGGKALARPVAVVIADDEGVRVEPVVDPTKIALAALTAAGFILSTLFKMVSMGRQQD
jgi:uncharacterized spore protein YtfJ